jgi:hypothetical protein
MIGSTSPIRVAMIVTITLALTTLAAAQRRDFATVQRANQAALRQYSWKNRTELIVDGETRQVRLEQVRYDIDGRLQKTVIGGGQAAMESEAGRRGGGPLKTRIVTRKKAEFREMLAELAALADSYAHPPADRMQAFATRAVMTEGQGIETGSARIHGRDLMAAGDEMTIWIEPATFALRRIEIAASHEGHPVRITTDYRNIESGPTYPARSIVRDPEEHVEIVIETFDYVRSGTR